MSELRQRIEAELLEGLNPTQQAAVLHADGPLLIVAGAGSGKTRVITHRIAHLCRVRGVRPYNIVAVTFTNKAAEEMRHRLERLIGPMAHDVFVRTFHSLGLYLLTRNAQAAGFKSNFTIYDAAGQTALLKAILKDLKIDAQQVSPAYAADVINRARDSLISPEKYVSEGFYAEDISRIYREYMRRLRANNAVDFGDLLYESVRLLERNQEVLEKYRTLWKHFLIDEYQDTNFAQYRLGRLIAQDHRNVTVVGDDDQSIYSWRGADVSNILNFEKDYPGCRVLKLEENYRSTKPILLAASSVIAHNEKRLAKTIYTNREGGQLPKLTLYDNEYEETRAVVSKIRSLLSQGRSGADFAIFYRTNAQSRVFEQLLLEEGLPFILVGSFRFFERKEIKDLLAYLAVIVNPEDSLSLERIINVPARGVGEGGLEKIRALALARGLPLLEALSEAGSIPRLRSAGALVKLRKLFGEWRRMHEAGESPVRIVEDVLERSELLGALKREHTAEAEGRLDNLSQFVDAVAEYEEQFVPGPEGAIATADFGAGANADGAAAGNAGEPAVARPNLEDYLQKLALFTSDTEAGAARAEGESLHLMTLHNAKGLEFPVVFLTGLEEGYVPHSFSIEEGNLDEERRLLYVGITRAKEELFLSTCRSRRIFGTFQPRRPSRFLEEIAPEALSRDSHRPQASFPAAGASARLSAPRAPVTENAERYSRGDRVEHRKYGTGIVTSVEETISGQKLFVHFQELDVSKTFLGRYTPMRRLSG